VLATVVGGPTSYITAGSRPFEGRISLQTIRGHVQVRAAGRTLDLPVGSLLALDPGLPHDVQALEESVPLLTIARPVH
jgi:quercetin dioxygenase-like cupin family protein